MSRKGKFPLSTFLYNLDHRLNTVHNPRTGISYPVASRLFELMSLEADPVRFASLITEIKVNYLLVERYLIEQKRVNELIRSESSKELADNIHLPPEDRFQGEYYGIVYITEEEMSTLVPHELTFNFFINRLRWFFNFTVRFLILSH